MTNIQKQDDNLEELLLNNDFYSFPSAISSSSSTDHLATLRKAVQIPNSISSNSISTGLLNPEDYSLSEQSIEDAYFANNKDTRTKLNSNNPFLIRPPSVASTSTSSVPQASSSSSRNQRTSFMKNSPSIKALENILTQRQDPSLTARSKINDPYRLSGFQSLIEENEDMENPVNISSLSINNSSETDPNRGSTYSVQTFQTALSHDSLNDSLQPASNTNKHTSISTIDEGYSTSEETPVLSQPATFYTMKQTGKDYSPKIVSEPVARTNDNIANNALQIFDINQVTENASSQSTNPSSSEQEDTLIDNPTGKKTINESIDDNTSSNYNLPAPTVSSTNNNSTSTLTNTNSHESNETPLNKPQLNPTAAKSNSNPHGSSKSQNVHAPRSAVPMSQPPPPIKLDASNSVSSSPTSRRPSTASIKTNGTSTTSRYGKSPSDDLRKPSKPSTPKQISSFRFDALSDTPNTINTINTINTAELVGTPKLAPLAPPHNPSKRSPHSRTNSTFSLNLSLQKPEVLGRHRRSNTVGDLAASGRRGSDNQSIRSGVSMASSTMAPDHKKSKLSRETTPTTKKFSFRNLFKSKSKSHGLSDKKGNPQPEVSQPKKLKNKSVSTPNFQEQQDGSPTSIMTTQTTATSSDRRKFFGRKKSDFESRSVAPSSPEKPPLRASPSSSSILNVFKKNKSNDALSGKIAQSETTSASVKSPAQPAPKPQDDDIDTTSVNNEALHTSRAFKSNSNINFIREVSDDDYNPNMISHGDSEHPGSVKQPSSHIATESPADFEAAEEDSLNLANHPPTNLVNQRFDQEMSLIPPPSDAVPKGTSQKNNAEPPKNHFGDDDDNIFGSPFDVDYDPSAAATPRIIEPEIPPQPKELESETTRVNDQLLGEALFPKSLSAQEVESIVSLERSRSMKSIRSSSGGNKRNSFANYNGSDDNIIQGNSMPLSKPNTGITRSGSILKNSASKRSLKVDPNEPSMNSIDANILSKDGNPKANNSDRYSFNDTTEENNYDDLMEFTDFIDVENLDFTNSPRDSMVRAPSPFEPAKNHGSTLSPPPSAEILNSRINGLIPPSSVLSTPPSSQNDQQPQSSPSRLNSKNNHEGKQLPKPPQAVDESTLLADNERSSAIDDTYNKSVDTNTASTLDTKSIPKSPESIIDSQNPINSSPILETAYKTSTGRFDSGGEPADNVAVLNDEGKSDYNNRPISMSFKGLKGPSFGGKIAMHDLRSSDSHQSFNISFEDESTEDEYGGVGGGFGSEADDAYSFEDKENHASDNTSSKFYSNSKLSNSISASNMKSSPSDDSISTSNANKKFGGSAAFAQKSNTASSALPPPQFQHERVASLSETNNSSPRSFTSIISKIKKSNNSPYSSPRVGAPVKPTKGGVRFSSRIILYDTYNGEEYDRHPDTATCNQLTPALAQQIREEINLLKSEMEVHEDSECYTHFI